jgi:FtsP/CotA-like multicopper oxidase with cupredoxin domain
MYHTAPHDPRALTFAGKSEAPVAFEDSVHHPMRDGAMSMDSMMGGMIIGITVHSRDRDAKPPLAVVPQRRLQLTVAAVAPAVTTVDKEMWPSFTYSLAVPSGPAASTTGGAPIIVLTRGVPVAITVINHLDEATAVHWHGIDVQDSYADGSGLADPWGRPATMIMPGKSFVARFTPTRAGTFMYHSHMDDPWQIPAGLAGALLVLEPGQRYDASTDHVVMITRPRDANSNMVNVNGTLSPAPIEMRASARQRLRFCNLTDLRTELFARLLPSESGALPPWKLVAQDGLDLHQPRSVPSDTGVMVTVGQTRDVEFVAPPPGTYTLQLQTQRGRALAKIPVTVR